MPTTAYLKRFVLAAATLLLTTPRGNGFMLVLLTMALLPVALYQSVRMLRRPEERKSRGISLAIGATVLLLAGTVQTYWSVASRNDADLAVQRVVSYRERHGSYPASLAMTGLDEQRLKRRWRLRYALDGKTARLSYPMTIMPLSSHDYDFEARAWRTNTY